MRPPCVAVAIAALALAAGCQEPDVGARCAVSWGTEWQTNPDFPPPPVPSGTGAVQGDYLETGNLACDSLVCVVSPVDSGKYASCDGGKCGYCSKPCVSDAECYEKETGLVCRQMVLDQAYIEALKAIDPVLAAKYVGGNDYARYCAVPL